METKWARPLAYGVWVLLALCMGAAGCAGLGGPVPSQKKDAGPEGETRITGIAFSEDAQASRVTIYGSRTLDYTSVKRPLPPGIVIYFPATAFENVEAEYEPKVSLVQRVRTFPLGPGQAAGRMEITVERDGSYNVRREGENLVVSFMKEAEKAQASALPSTSQGREMTRPEKAGSSLAPASAEKAPAPTAAAEPRGRETRAPALVRGLDFIQEDDGRSTVVVRTSRKVPYEVVKAGDKGLLVQLTHATIPKHLLRPLITTRFESAADRVVPVVEPGKDRAGVLVELREAVPYHVEEKENAVLLHLDPSRIGPRTLAQAKLPDWQEAASGVRMERQAPEQEKSAAQLAAPVMGEGGKKYTGEKISLDFYKTDIKNVFRILRQVSGLNFAVEKDVVGEVTLTLDKPVPWDQVLDLILKMNRLGMKREGDIVRIATQETLDTMDASEKAKEKAELAAKEEMKITEPLETEYISINYSSASDIMKHIEEIKSERGTVSVDGRTNTIIMKDVRENLETAKALAKRLDKVTPQVLIEARIVEANTNFSRQFGINWGGQSGIQPGSSRVGVGPQRGYDALGGTYGYNWAMNYPAATPTGAIGFNFSRTLGLTPLTLDATLSAMESRGDGKIISAPKIVTLDNKKAVIKQGLKYPLKKQDESGNTVTTFEQVDLLLEVTPHVTQDERVSMQIRTTKNDVGPVISGEQSFTTKEAETELLVNDGDTVVIGGVIKSTRRNTNEGFPWLSQVPVLGWLFGSKAVSDDREELLVFITPRIIHLESN